MRARRNLLAFLLGFVLVVYGGLASSAESCRSWRINSGSPLFFNQTSVEPVPATQLCSAYIDAFVAYHYGPEDPLVYGEIIHFATTAIPWECATNYNLTYRSSGAPHSYSNWHEISMTDLGAATCPEPPPDPCDAYEGKKVTYAQQFAALPEMGTNFNIPVAGGCGANMSAASSCSANSGGYFCMVTYTYTGDAPEASPTSPAGSAAECAYVAGEKNCAITTDETLAQTCGVLSGERVCFPADPTSDPDGQPPSGSCWSTPAGGALCAADADVEDSEGDPVSPTSVIVTNNSTSNYYSSSTLQSSGGTAVVTGTGTMGGESTTDPNCEGVDCLTGGDMDTPAGSGEIADGIYDRIGGAPIIAAVSGLSGSLSGGSCPSWSSSINAGAFGTFALDFSFICTMWDDIASIIAAVMLAGWAFLALRILMSA